MGKRPRCPQATCMFAPALAVRAARQAAAATEPSRHLFGMISCMLSGCVLHGNILVQPGFSDPLHSRAAAIHCHSWRNRSAAAAAAGCWPYGMPGHERWMPQPHGSVMKCPQDTVVHCSECAGLLSVCWGDSSRLIAERDRRRCHRCQLGGRRRTAWRRPGARRNSSPSRRLIARSAASAGCRMEL